MRVKRFKYQSYLLPLDTLPSLSRYGLAALTVSIAAIATYGIPIISQRAAYLLFFFAITQSSAWLGKNIGVFAMALSLVTVNIEFLLPLWHSEPTDALLLNTGFCVFSALIIATTSLQRKLALSILENQHDLKQAQAIGHVGNWRLDVQQNELFWSEENHRIFGIPDGTLLSYETFLDKVAPEDREYVNQMWQAALSGQPYDIEHRIIVDGKIKWVRERAELEFASNGDLLGGFGTTQDITDHKLHDLELQENRQRYVNIIESAMDAIITIDADQCILVFNTAAEKMFGINANEAIGTSLERFVPKQHHALHAKHIHAFGRTRISKRIMNSMGVVTGLRTNGEEFPIEVAISHYALNHNEYYTAIIRDITERTQAEFILNEQLRLQDQLTKVAATVPGVICSFCLHPDGSSHMPYASPAFESVMGLNLDLATKDFSHFFARIHPDDLNLVHATAAESARTSQLWRHSFRYNHPTKEEIWLESHATPRHESNGSVFWHGYIQDVTQRIHVKQELQERIERYELVLEGAHDAIWDWDIRNNSVHYSSRWKTLRGLEEHEVSDHANEWSDRIHPDDKARILAALQSHLANKTPIFLEEYRTLCKDGSWIWIADRGIAQRNNTGQAIRMAGSENDITQRKAAETALREREKELRLIMDAIPTLISYIDTHFRYIRVNKAYENWFGIPQEQILGRKVKEIIGTNAWAFVHPYIERACAGEQVRFDYHATFEYGIKAIPRWVLITYIPDQDESGNVIGIVAHVVDIDDRKRAEQQISLLNKDLQNKIDEMQVIFDTVPIGLAIADDMAGTHIRGNPAYAQMLGVAPGSELPNKSRNAAAYQMIENGQVLAVEKMPLQRTIQGDKVKNQEIEILRPDGKALTLLANTSPLLNEDGTIRGAVGAFLDITTIKEAGLELHKFASLADNSQEFIGMCDMSFMPFYVNKAGMELVGIDNLEQAFKTPVPEFFFPEDQQFIREEFFPRVFQEQRGEVEIRFRHFKTGEAIWMIYNVFYIKNDRNEPIGIATVSRDITTRKIAEQSLIESQQENTLLADLIRTSSQPMGIGYPDGRLGMVNLAFEALTGYSARELQNIDWATELTPPEWHEIESNQLAELQRTGLPVRYEKEYLRKDGSRVPIELIVNLVTDKEGKTDYFSAFLTDITERKQAEATLRESENRMRLATEATGVGIWEWHVSSKRIRWDAQMFRIYGITPTHDGIVDYNIWSSAVLPEDLRNIEETLQDTNHLSVHRTREFRIKRVSDQAIRHIQSVEATRTNSHGKIEWLVGTNLDVTELQQATNALKASEAFVRDVLNSLPEHVVVLNEHGTVTAVNEPWECFALDNEASPRDVAVGANYLEVCRKSSLAGDLYARVALSGLESLIVGTKEKFVMEYPCQTPKSNLWFLMSAIRMHHGSGGIILSHLDITERKQAETALHESETKLSLIMEEVKASYWDWDLESGAIYSSPEWKRQIGFDVTEPLSPWEEWECRLHPEDKAMVLMATKDCITGRKLTLEYRYRILHKTGSYRWIHSHGALMRNHEGIPKRVVGINLDITDYMNTKELNERREEMEKSTRLYIASQTAAAIAHELNQPLTAISYYAFVAQNMLKMDNPNSHKLEQVLEKCGKQAQRAGDAIQQLLALLHKGETVSEPIDINKLVNYVVEYVKADGQSPGFIIQLNLSEDLPPIKSNALQIQKVLINLINNGMESIKESGKDAGTIGITTSLSPTSSAFVQVSVRDCGDGASDKETLSKIFQPFYTTKSTGLGMGLAISRALVEGHGGKMWAEQNSDTGLTIHFTLPFVS